MVKTTVHRYNIRYNGIDLDDTGVYFAPDYPVLDPLEFARIKKLMFKNIVQDLGNEVTQLVKKPNRLVNDF